MMNKEPMQLSNIAKNLDYNPGQIALVLRADEFWPS